MKKQLFIMTSVLILVSILLTACQPQTVVETVEVEKIVEKEVEVEKIVEKEVVVEVEKEVMAAEVELAPGELKVALLLDGVINDGGWNQSAYDGLAVVKTKYMADTAYTENVQRAEMETVFEDYAARGYQIIFAHGFEFSDAAAIVAAKYPDSIFVVTHASTALTKTGLPNVAGLQYMENDVSYLMGILAGYMTETNIWAGVGGFAIPVLVVYYDAFQAGAESVNPDIKGIVTYIDSWYDVQKAMEANRAAIAQGADIIFPQTTNPAAAQVAIEENALMFGYGLDMYNLAPSQMVTSGIVDTAFSIQLLVDEYVTGKFEAKDHWYGMDSGVVRLAPYHDFEDKIPQEAKDKVAEIEALMKKGEFENPIDAMLMLGE